jgi:hypothetical protein
VHIAQAALDCTQHREKLAQLMAVISLEQALLDRPDSLHYGLDRAPAGRRQLQGDLASVALMQAALDEPFVEEPAHGA